MKGILRIGAVSLCLWAAAPWTAAKAEAQGPLPLEAGEETTVTLQELLALARERSPRVLAAERRAEASRMREPAAGLLPDPLVQLGAMNLALPQLSADMPASMAPTIQLMQRFPVAGKLSLREEMARQSTSVDVAAAQEVWWQVRAEVAAAFFQLFRIDRQIRVAEETLGLLRDFETIARSMYAAGTGRQADVLRARVEVARMEAEIESQRGGRRGAAAHLNALLDRPANTPVPLAELGSLPVVVPDQATLLAWASDGKPLLEGMRQEVARASTRRRLAQKEIWPDFTVGLQYGLGRMGGDLRSMGGASVGFSLPVHAGRRQRKLEDEAAAQEAEAHANFSGALAAVDARLVELVAELDQARILLGLYREEILPQAQAAVRSSLSAYRAGTVDFNALVDAQMAVNRFRGEYFGLLASYGAALARLETTIGRALPETDELITEDR